MAILLRLRRASNKQIRNGLNEALVQVEESCIKSEVDKRMNTILKEDKGLCETE